MAGSVKYTVAQIKEILENAEKENRCALKIATDKAVKGQANSVFLSGELEVEKDRFIPYPMIEIKNVVTSSNLTFRKDEKGMRQNLGEVATSIMPITIEDLAETKWNPDTFQTLVDYTNEYVAYAEVYDRQSKRAIEADILKKAALLMQKGISISNRKIIEFVQRARKIKPSDDVTKALEDGRIPLEKPITRIVAKIDKDTDRIGYMPKPQKDGKPPSFRYTFKMKGKKNPKTNKNDLIVLRVPDSTGRPQDLTGTNCHLAVTRRSIITGTISSEVIISSQGISRKFKFFSAVVHPHEIIERNDFSEEDMDALDSFGEAYVPTYVPPSDAKFEDSKVPSNGYTGAASLTGTAEQSLVFDEPDANPIGDAPAAASADDAAADPDADADAEAIDADAADAAAEEVEVAPEPVAPPPPPPKPVAVAAKPGKPVKPGGGK